MRLEHHLVGGYVRYISPYIIIIIIIINNAQCSKTQHSILAIQTQSSAEYNKIKQIG